jgi:hypothetical protein
MMTMWRELLEVPRRELKERDAKKKIVRRKHKGV